MRPISGGSDADQAAEPVATPAVPTFVPADEFKQFQATISSALGGINEGLRAIAADRQARSVTPQAPIEDVSDEEIERALSEGRGAQTFRKMVRAERERLVREEIAPLRTQGLQAISSLTQDAVLSQKAHYDRFREEINDVIGRTDPTLRTRRETYEAAYRIVVGAHTDELVDEAREAALRGPKEVASEPGGRSGRIAGRGGPTLTVVESMGADSDAALRAKGQTGEDFARRLGYKSWADYAALKEAQENG
jgi:hypothetical protein